MWGRHSDGELTHLGILLLLFIVFFFETGFLRSFEACPGTCSVDQALYLPSAGTKHAPSLPGTFGNSDAAFSLLLMDKVHFLTINKNPSFLQIWEGRLCSEREVEEMAGAAPHFITCFSDPPFLLCSQIHSVHKAKPNRTESTEVNSFLL